MLPSASRSPACSPPTGRPRRWRAARGVAPPLGPRQAAEALCAVLVALARADVPFRVAFAGPTPGRTRRSSTASPPSVTGSCTSATCPLRLRGPAAAGRRRGQHQAHEFFGVATVEPSPPASCRSCPTVWPTRSWCPSGSTTRCSTATRCSTGCRPSAPAVTPQRRPGAAHRRRACRLRPHDRACRRRLLRCPAATRIQVVARAHVDAPVGRQLEAVDWKPSSR